MSGGRKRKAGPKDDETEDDASRGRVEPTSVSKRARVEITGRPLALSRLFETLNADALRSILETVCSQHTDIAADVQRLAPRPDVDAALNVLAGYERQLQAAFPFGDDRASDYAYNRVRTHLRNLLDALGDFLPQFLPPHELQPSRSMSFLDGATAVVHRLPEWQSFMNNMHKHEAYERLCHAWLLAIRESSKRAAGLQLKLDDWESKVRQHNHVSNGRMLDALTEISTVVGWIGAGHESSRSLNIRQELFSGQFGAEIPTQVAPW